MTIQAWIEQISLPNEDRTNRPQRSIALPPMFVYDQLMIIKNSLKSLDARNLRQLPTEEIFIFTISCFKLCSVPESNCGSYENGCLIQRSKHPIPNHTGNLIDVINPITKVRFSEVDQSELEMMMCSDDPTVKLGHYYYKENFGGKEHLFIVSKGGVEHPNLTIRAYFNDPLDVVKVNSCMGKDAMCDFMSLELQVDARYQESILLKGRQILNQLLNLSRVGDRVTDDVDASQITTERDI